MQNSQKYPKNLHILKTFCIFAVTITKGYLNKNNMSKIFERLYTTTEEGKKLMDLGIPIDTADCYYGKNDTLLVLQGNIPSELCWNVGCIPCWSVGRLVQIFEVCTGLKFERKRWKESSNNLLEDVLEQLDLAISDAIDGVKFDISKLND